jgi:hypothetical protein
MSINKEEKEALFFSKPFYFSYSSIAKIFTPRIFYEEYILKQRDVNYSKSKAFGSLIHFYMLDEQNFTDKFVMFPEKLPSENTREVIHYIYESCEVGELDTLLNFKKEILEYLKKIDLHQKLKEDEARLEKIINVESERYFRYLIISSRKTPVTAEEAGDAKALADKLKNDPKIVELLGLDKMSDQGVYNELHLTMDLVDYPFALQGILDNVVVDINNKTIRVTDIKTTSKSLLDFKEMVESYKYPIQVVIYKLLVMNFLRDVIDDEWKVEFRFLVVDKFGQYYPFVVSDESFKRWEIDFHESVLERLSYHINSKDFTLPYEFVTGVITL